jgi:hypothetical protein
MNYPVLPFRQAVQRVLVSFAFAGARGSEYTPTFLATMRRDVRVARACPMYAGVTTGM